ncbi:hypothetical protein JHK82_043516 [Glycine max]|nr:hypothetical protein JHK86_043408 [Glycine max]KAG5106546.1 hypothetical protein JHK82_043516 [Glycine max]KAG5117475.1 hypothetical protein JHK84_043588 [Glycine max]
MSLYCQIPKLKGIAEDVYNTIKKARGLFTTDEVQAGFGRIEIIYGCNNFIQQRERQGDRGESETFLQKVVQEQGRGRIMDTINEIQEKHDVVKEIQKNLKELHQVFLDMTMLVQHQGE